MLTKAGEIMRDEDDSDDMCPLDAEEESDTEFLQRELEECLEDPEIFFCVLIVSPNNLLCILNTGFRVS